MNTIWKGAISFGLVNVPVKLYAATESKDTKFNYLHQPCKTPIQYQKYCPTCRRAVTQEEIVRGFEYEQGKYVIMTDDDFDRIAVSTAKTIDILDFVDLKEIDPIYFSRSYYLVPNDGGQKAFFLLRRALEQTGKIAVARVTLRAKESLAVVRVYQNLLVMETIFYPNEIRSTAVLPEGQAEVKLQENEIKMAISLIDSLSEPFEPAKYTDNYREALREIIEAKIAGEEVAVPEQREKGQVVDLMEALRASIKAAKQGKKENQPAPQPVAEGAAGQGTRMKRRRKTS